MVIKNQINVQSLIGSKEIGFYLRCLNSLVKYSEEEIKLTLHATEKLSCEEKKQVENSLKNCNLNITESHTNAEKTLDLLADYPNCQKLRKNSLWGIEFFDPIFAFKNENYSNYLDADILFIKPFRGLFDKDVIRGGCVFKRQTMGCLLSQTLAPSWFRQKTQTC